MKKILFFIFVSLSLCHSNAYAESQETSEEKFLNPVFYEKMISASHSNFEIQLTPTSIHMMESESFIYDYTCKLINNQMDSISLECFKYDYNKKKEPTKIFTYNLKLCTEENRCLDEGAG